MDIDYLGLGDRAHNGSLFKALRKPYDTLFDQDLADEVKPVSFPDPKKVEARIRARDAEKAKQETFSQLPENKSL
ncbi:MAG: hypothetical protein ACOY3I_05480 [Verrucomicrobiota bacterium]